jgi:hypothetical protein
VERWPWISDVGGMPSFHHGSALRNDRDRTMSEIEHGILDGPDDGP